MKRLLMLMLATAVLGACSDSTSPSSTVEGTYTLQTVNGSQLPFTAVQSTDYKLEVLSGTATLNANGTFTHSITTRETVDGVAETETDPSSGTWSRSGSTLTFVTTGPDADVSTAAWANGTITVVNVEEGVTYTFVFKK